MAKMAVRNPVICGEKEKILTSVKSKIFHHSRSQREGGGREEKKLKAHMEKMKIIQGSCLPCLIQWN